MAEFAVTFGRKYKTEPHPKLGLVEPDGYLVVVAEDEEKARDMIAFKLGDAWAFIYPMVDFNSSYYPLGVLGTIHESSAWVPIDPWVWSRHMLSLTPNIH